MPFVEDLHFWGELFSYPLFENIFLKVFSPDRLLKSIKFIFHYKILSNLSERAAGLICQYFEPELESVVLN